MFASRTFLPASTILSKNIFCTSLPTVYIGTAENNGNSDFYISHKDNSGEWGEMKNLGLVINSAENEHSPSLSPHGEYQLFSCNRKKTLPHSLKSHILT